DSLRAIPAQARARLHAAWKGIRLPRHFWRQLRPKADGRAPRPSPEAVEKAPSGTVHSRALREDRIPAFRYVGAATGAGPARIPHSPWLRRRRPARGRSSEHFLHARLNGGAGAARRRDDKDSVVARERSGDFFPAFGVDGGCQRLRTPGRGLENEQILRRPD